MSKLQKLYDNLKSKDSKKIYIFEVGIFYNILNEDARIVSEKTGLKLTDLGPNMIKCGFPVSKLEKYTDLLKENNIDYKVIPKANIVAKNQPASYSSIIKKIQNLDLDNMTCKEAFDILYNIQQNIKNM